MEETRTISIDRKVFNKKDIEVVSKIFTDEYQSSNEKKNSTTLAFTYKFLGSSIQSESPDMFDDHGILDMKKTLSIDFTFFDHTDGKYINFTITHGNYGSNQFKIRGNGDIWARHIADSFVDLLASLKPQSNIRKHEYSIAFILAFLISFTIVFYIYKIIGRPMAVKLNHSTTLGQLYILLFSIWLIGYAIACTITNWLVKLWPSIEFDFGPEHMKFEKNKKVKLGIVSSVVIIPIIIAIFI